MLPHLPEELTAKIVSSINDCRTIVQACTAIDKSGCDGAVWERAARRLDVAARGVYKEYFDTPQANTVWSSDKIRYPSPFMERHEIMTKSEFVYLCKFATRRTQFLANLRSLRHWMFATGWESEKLKRVRIPITSVAFEFHSMRRMNANGIRIMLRFWNDGRAELTYQRVTPRNGERWDLWYPVDSDERLYTLLPESIFKAVQHFARSPNLHGASTWYGAVRTWEVTVKPPA